MFTRLTVALASLLACFASYACGDAYESSGVAILPDFVPGATLEILGPDSIVVATRGSAELRVTYRRRADAFGVEATRVGGVAVEFALVGDAKASSLSPAQAITNTDGEAASQLAAGSDSASYRVRVSAEGALPVYIAVRVEPSVEREVEIDTRYRGRRGLVSRTIAALPGVGCEDAKTLPASNMTGVAIRADDRLDESVTFRFGPGLHYAILASGRDARGGLLAEGCSEIDVPANPDAAMEGVVIHLRDRPLTLAGSYEVTLALDVEPWAQLAADAAEAGARALLQESSTADADYFLAAINKAFRDAGKVGEAEALAQALMRTGALAASLQSALDADGVGPRAGLDALAAQMASQGRRLALEAIFTVTSVANVPMGLKLRRMQAGPSGGQTSLDGSDVHLPDVLIDADYDDARAVLAVKMIKIDLPLGVYGGHLLDALDAIEPNGLRGLLEDQSGCGQLVTWAAAQEALAASCDQGCVRAVCESAWGALLREARTGLSALDDVHASIGLRGELTVSDRDRDSIVDELEDATLEGSWGTASTTEQADAIEASFSVRNFTSPL